MHDLEVLHRDHVLAAVEIIARGDELDLADVGKKGLCHDALCWLLAPDGAEILHMIAAEVVLTLADDHEPALAHRDAAAALPRIGAGLAEPEAVARLCRCCRRRSLLGCVFGQGVSHRSWVCG